MDKYYNSMLFSKSPVDSIEIEDKAIDIVIKDSYKFRFDKLPLDLFGSFYENYIGYIINDEGEIIKSNKTSKTKGIYYTPPSVVGTIIKLTLRKKMNTLFNKIKKKKPIPPPIRIQSKESKIGRWSKLKGKSFTPLEALRKKPITIPPKDTSSGIMR